MWGERMSQQKEFKAVVDEYLEKMLGATDRGPDDYRQPFQIMDRIKSPDDIDAAIIETNAAFDHIRKRKDKVDLRRVWSLLGTVLMITGIITVKGLLPTIVFIFGTIVGMIFFSKAQRAVSPLTIEIKAYEGVLLELHKMKILHEQVDKSSA